MATDKSSDTKENFTEDVVPPVMDIKSSKDVEGDTDSRTTASISKIAVATATDKSPNTKETFSENAAPAAMDKNSSTSRSTTPVGRRVALVIATPEEDIVPFAPPTVVSPTNTHNTYNTYKTYATTDSAPHEKIVVISNEKKDKSPILGTALICGMKKPILCICLVVILGVIATNLLGWFRVPGLDTQIQRLNAEITNLDDEVYRLSGAVEDLRDQNDRYQLLNKDLEGEVGDLKTISRSINSTTDDLYLTNEGLRASNSRISRTIDDLNTVREELQSIEAGLNNEIDALNATNEAIGAGVENITNITNVLESKDRLLRKNLKQLNSTHLLLELKVRDLENATEIINASIAVYKELNLNLTEQEEDLRSSLGEFTAQLVTLNANKRSLSWVEGNLTIMIQDLNNTSLDQNETLIVLQEQLADVTREADRLKDLNSNIKTVLNYINVVNIGNYDTLTQISNFVDNSNKESEKVLEGNNEILLQRHTRLFRDHMDDWDCTYEYEFAGNQWAIEDNWTKFPINAAQLDSIINYVEKRVFRPYCLNTADFRSYLKQNNHSGLKDAVDSYTDNAEEYYYGSDSNVTTEDWARANFSCHNLENNYMWTDKNANIFDKVRRIEN